MMRMSLMLLADQDDDDELELEMEVTTLDTNLMITIYDDYDDDDYDDDDYDYYELMEWHCLRLDYRCLY